MTKQEYIKAFKDAIREGDDIQAVISNRMSKKDVEAWHEGYATRNVNAWQEALKTLFGDYVTVHVYGWLEQGPEVSFLPDEQQEAKLAELEEKLSYYAVYVEHSQHPEMIEPLTEKRAYELYNHHWGMGTPARIFQYKAGWWYNEEGETIEDPHHEYSL